MVLFFRTAAPTVIAVEVGQALSSVDTEKLCWLFGNAVPAGEENISGWFVGPRREMITPWSTNAVEITQNMGIAGIVRIEEFFPAENGQTVYDRMLQRLYDGLDQRIFEKIGRAHV